MRTTTGSQCRRWRSQVCDRMRRLGVFNGMMPNESHLISIQEPICTQEAAIRTESDHVCYLGQCATWLRPTCSAAACSSKP